MRTRAETLLIWMAGLAALLTFASLGLAATGVPTAVWPAMALLYLTAVCYGLAEMTRLFQRHRRRCPACLEGTRPHVLWWAPRVLLVLLVSVLPILLLLPVASNLHA